VARVRGNAMVGGSFIVFRPLSIHLGVRPMFFGGYVLGRLRAAIQDSAVTLVGRQSDELSSGFA